MAHINIRATYLDKDYGNLSSYIDVNKMSQGFKGHDPNEASVMSKQCLWCGLFYIYVLAR